MEILEVLETMGNMVIQAKVELGEIKDQLEQRFIIDA